MINDMPQEPDGSKATGGKLADDEVKKYLADQEQLQTHRHDLINEVLRQNLIWSCPNALSTCPRTFI